MPPENSPYRRGLEHHVWPMIITLFARTKWPHEIESLPQGAIRSEAEVTLAATIGQQLHMILIRTQEGMTLDRHSFLSKQDRTHPELASIKNELRICESRERSTFDSLYSHEKSMLRLGALDDSTNACKKHPPIKLIAHFERQAYPTDAFPPEVIQSRLATLERFTSEYLQAKCAFEVVRTKYSKLVEQLIPSTMVTTIPVQFFENEVKSRTGESFPIYDAIRDLGDWWIKFSNLAAKQLATECMYMGHYLTCRAIYDKPSFDTEKRLTKSPGFDNTHDRAERLEGFYQTFPHWFTGADDIHGKLNRPSKNWDLHRLEQALERQDQNVDAWFDERGGIDQPSHPKYRRETKYDLEFLDAQTRLLWILIRDSQNSPHLKNIHNKAGGICRTYSDEQFSSIILECEKKLIQHYEDASTRAHRMEHVQLCLFKSLKL